MKTRFFRIKKKKNVFSKTVRVTKTLKTATESVAQNLVNPNANGHSKDVFGRRA